MRHPDNPGEEQVDDHPEDEAVDEHTGDEGADKTLGREGADNGQTSSAINRITFRWIIGIGTAIALAIILISTTSAGGSELERSEPSAIRLAQIYTEGAFYAVVATGFALSAYILSRAGPDA